MISKRPSRLVPGDVIVVLDDEVSGCWRIKADPRGTAMMERVALKVESVVHRVVSHRVALRHPDGSEVVSEIPTSCVVEIVPKHHPVCGECGELWPCRDVRVAEGRWRRCSAVTRSRRQREGAQ